MKQKYKLLIALCLVAVLTVPCVWSILYYTRPMAEASYNLSLIAEDGQEWEGDKGWTVYTNERGTVTPLTPDGTGGYTGIAYAGQTFYFSRQLTESLESPTLQIGAVNRSIAVFLDDTMIYSDQPEAGEHIGELTLSMLPYDRLDPLTVSLPPDYKGKTLTIAQSTPAAGFSEKQEADPAYFDPTVYPADIILYCGYAYESGLIAGTAQTMIPAVLLLALILFFFAAFLWKASLGRLEAGLLVFALTAFLQMGSVLVRADFFFRYFGTLPVDLTWLCFHLSVGALLTFLAIYAGKGRPFYGLLALIQFLTSGVSAAVQIGQLMPYGDNYVFLTELPQITGFLTLLAAVIAGFILWRKENAFFKHFSQAALVLITGYALAILISCAAAPDYAHSVAQRIVQEAVILLPNFTLKLLWRLGMLSALYAAVYDLFEQETKRRTESAVLAAKNALTLESYENLRIQNDETQMLRHDMVKHYRMLLKIAEETPEKTTDYLKNLIGESEKIRSVVKSGNQTVDMIINGELNRVANKKIAVHIVRAQAPVELTMTDTDACCLFMNILDNAIHGAESAKEPWIQLDFHIKNHHFIFCCENSCAIMTKNKIPAKGHGYGLKIIQEILERYDGVSEVERTETTYKFSMILPL